MIEVRAYQPGDLDRIVPQPGQAGEDAIFHPSTPEAGPSFTIVRVATAAKPEELLFVGGLAEGHANYASTWAVLASGLAGDYHAVARAIRRVIGASRYRRVDMMVKNDWDRAHAFARVLGMQFEGVMRGVGEQGEDYSLYARVRPLAVAEGE